MLDAMVDNSSAVFSAREAVVLAEPAGRRGAGSSTEWANPFHVDVGVLIQPKSLKARSIRKESDIPAVADPQDQLETIRIQHQRAMIDAQLRAVELHLWAKMEGERFSAESQKHLLAFLRRQRVKERPRIFLLENGNLRALWRKNSGEQIGLEFQPDGRIRYVLFVARDGKMARSWGDDDSQHVGQTIIAKGAAHLIA